MNDAGVLAAAAGLEAAALFCLRVLFSSTCAAARSRSGDSAEGSADGESAEAIAGLPDALAALWSAANSAENVLKPCPETCPCHRFGKVTSASFAAGLRPAAEECSKGRPTADGDVSLDLPSDSEPSESPDAEDELEKLDSESELRVEVVGDVY